MQFELALRPAYLLRLALTLMVGIATIDSAVANDTGFAGIHDWRSERGKICLIGHFHTGVGEGRSKKLARRAAVKDWQEFTAWEYGTSWAYFRRAASRGVKFTKTEAGWQASVKGRACKRSYRRRAKRR
jgi:hypothetical protein